MNTSSVCPGLHHAPRWTHLQGSRALHLIHHLFAKDFQGHSSAQLASLRKKTYPHADTVSLKLFDGEGPGVLFTTLSQALLRLKPLSYLAEAKRGAYRIDTFPGPKPGELIDPSKVKPKSFKRAGRSKEVHLNTAGSPQFLRHILSRAYCLILAGSRIEFHLHQNAGDKSKRTVDWAVENCLHLRPDSILAAMPEGTTMLAEPVTSDLSFKTKVPKDIEKSKSSVMWAVENTRVLQMAGIKTPEEIKKLAKWAEPIRRKGQTLRVAAPKVETP